VGEDGGSLISLGFDLVGQDDSLEGGLEQWETSLRIRDLLDGIGPAVDAGSLST
jgi:hypothetical protein